MHLVYIIKSLKTDILYAGCAKNIKKHIEEHRLRGKGAGLTSYFITYIIHML